MKLAGVGLALLGAAVDAQVALWGQCGGSGYTGSTTCAAGAVCSKQNDFYSQCTPSANQPPPSAATPSPSPATTKPPLSASPSTSASNGQPPITNSGVSSYNWCGKRKWLALTFDDNLPQPALNDLLADLRTYGIKASFMITPALWGVSDANFCTSLKAVYADGHSINSHSYSHPDFLKASAADRASEIKKVEDMVSVLRLALEVNKMGYTVIGWTYNPVDSDSKTYQLANVWANTLREFNKLPSGGSAVILHHTPAYVSAGTKGMIAKYKNYFAPLGYQFVTVNQCFDACRADNDCKLANFGTGVYDSGTFNS
ncbi:hypothetical protein AeRB84_012222 [Aphanomyces euteiches]|nr:hypothetical protein AeRB84_012222 [Aphanomyces euteiches]